MNHIPALLALPFSALLFAASARAEVHEALDYSHYEVRAKPGRPLSQALNDASPFRPGDKVFHSATAWNLDWQVRPEPTSDGRCRVAEVRVNLQGSMVLPRLVEGDGVQRKRFAEYLPRLREHEMGHFEIGREAARKLEESFHALAAARSCSELQSAARDAGARMLPKYEAMGAAYDLHTQHGRTQGAWLTD